MFADKILRGQSLTVCGTGDQQRDFVCVDDAVQATVAALGVVSDGAQIVNICTAKPVTLADVVAALRAATDLPVDVIYDEG